MNFLKNISASPPPQLKSPKPIDGAFLFLLAITIGSGGLVILQKGTERALEISFETLHFITALSPKIVAGIFIASTLPLLLPRNKVALWIGKDSGLRGIALACLAGAAIPGGPMMIFPLAAGLMTAGAEIGAITTFLTSWSLLGLNRTLIWEFSFFAPEMVWLRWIVSAPLPLLLGLATQYISLRFGK